VATPARPRLRPLARSPASDPRAGEAEEGGQQRDRGDHEDQDDDRDRDADGGQERDAGDGQAQDRDHDRAAGEDDGPAGGRDGAAGGLLDRHAARQVLAVAGDQQQHVVDADALIAPSVTARLLAAFSHSLADAPPAQPAEPLTTREEEVLARVAGGRTNAEIADELFISLSTTKTHLASLMSKLGARNRVELAMWAYETDRVRG
jgi:DNA-binding CsgD family transcriptional regulator